MSNYEINLAINFVKSCSTTEQVVDYIMRPHKRLSNEELYTAYVIVGIQRNYEQNGGELNYFDEELIHKYGGELADRDVAINYDLLIRNIYTWLGH